MKNMTDDEIWRDYILPDVRHIHGCYAELLKAIDCLAERVGYYPNYIENIVFPKTAPQRRDMKRIKSNIEKEKELMVSQIKKDLLIQELGLTKEQLAILES